MTERTGERTEIISVHKLRSMARGRENRLQRLINQAFDPNTPSAVRAKAGRQLMNDDVPDWAKGVRVRKAGNFQHVVEATEWRGH